MRTLKPIVKGFVAIVASLFVAGNIAVRTEENERLNVNDEAGQYISVNDMKRLLQGHHMICYEFNRQNACKIALYPRRVSEGYMIADAFSLLAGPAPGLFVKVLLSERFDFKADGLCSTMRQNPFDQATFFISRNDFARIVDGDSIIPENDGPAELRKMLNNLLAPEITGEEECSKFEPWERRGQNTYSYRDVAFQKGFPVQDRTMEFHLFDKKNSEKIRLLDLSSGG